MDLNIGNLYDLNKQAMATEKPLDPLVLNEKYEELYDFLQENFYSLLICRERNDITVFHTTGKMSKYSGMKELRETLTNRGFILAVDKQKDGAYEIWIRDFVTEENFAYYLCNYTSAVVDV